MGKIMIKSAYRLNNCTKFRKWITRGKFLHFRSTIDTSSSRTRIEFITFIFVKKLSKLCKEFCKENLNIKLVFTSFKIKNYFSHKDPIPDDKKSFVVYKFTCASCSSSYIGETCQHFKTRIQEHIKKDNKSHVFKHIHSTATCFDSYNSLSFEIIHKANSKFDLKLKEALQIE